MPIPYILLSDESISIQLPTGPITINPNTLNYRPIRKALVYGSDIDVVTTLLSVKAPKGIYYAIEYCNHLYIKFISPITYLVSYHPAIPSDPMPSDLSKVPISSAYPSREALIADYPEYFI